MILFQSCLSVAKLSDFSLTTDGLDFDKISTLKQTEKNNFWTSKTEYEYYIESKITNDSLIINVIKETLLENRYAIRYYNPNYHTIIGERGLMAHEWKSIVGIYYQINNEASQIYIKSKITQDITGSLGKGIATKIGERLCKKLSCIEAYPVFTKNTVYLSNHTKFNY